MSSYGYQGSKANVVSIEYEESDIDKQFVCSRSENHVTTAPVGIQKREKQVSVIELDKDSDKGDSSRKAARRHQKNGSKRNSRRQSRGQRQSGDSLTHFETVQVKANPPSNFLPTMDHKVHVIPDCCDSNWPDNEVDESAGIAGHNKAKSTCQRNARLFTNRHSVESDASCSSGEEKTEDQISSNERTNIQESLRIELQALTESIEKLSVSQYFRPHDMIQREKAELLQRVATAEEQAAVFKRRAAKAEREASNLLDLVVCPCCYKHKEHMLLATTCGHRICFDCFWEWGSKECTTCRSPLKAKSMKRLYY